MFEVDSRQIDGLETGNRRPQQRSPTSVVGQSGGSRDVRVKSGSPSNFRHSFDSSGRQEWNGPAALRPNVLAAALANKLARIAWTVLAQGRGYEARVAAIESCDRRIRRASSTTVTCASWLDVICVPNSVGVPRLMVVSGEMPP